MFRAKTVFVIGAGASIEVGLPIGAELLRQIVGLTRFTFELSRRKTGDEFIFNALKILLDEGSEVTKLNEHLSCSKAARSVGNASFINR